MRKYRIVQRYFSEFDRWKFVPQQKILFFWMDLGWDISYGTVEGARKIIKEVEKRLYNKSHKQNVVIEKLEFK